MKTLPLAIKHALSTRNPVPSSPSTGSLFKAFANSLSKAKPHQAERAWLSVTTAALLALNSPPAVAHLYRFANTQSSAGVRPSLPSSPTDKNHAEPNLENLRQRTNNAAVMREAALKCSVFVGVPRVINTLAALTLALEDDVKGALSSTTRAGAATTPEAMRSAGETLWAQIYEPHSAKLLQKLHSYHPDFPTAILNSYGTVLARFSQTDPGAVGRALTSAIGVACLRAESGVGPQLTSHVYGLFKADGQRLSTETSMEPGDQWLSTEAGVQWVLDTVDTLGDALGAAGGGGGMPEQAKL